MQPALGASLKLIIVYLTYASCSETIADGKTVEVEQGTVRGFVHEETGANVFLGIPYASPPVGQFRFNHPQPANTWSGTFNATEHPQRCLQMSDRADLFRSPPAGDSEDCLYLNIFAPSVSF